MYRLRKANKKERKFLGVCAGISKYIDPSADPSVMRIIWVILTCFNPVPMIIFYLILGLILKPENYEFRLKKDYGKKEEEPMKD